MLRLVLLFVTLMLCACTPTSITISLGAPTATATPTLTPTLSPPTATATSTPDFTATAQVQASATAQAKATADGQATATANAQASATAQAKATADAQASATAQARASATAVAATAQANATATAKAATEATKTAILAYVDALVQKAEKPVRFPDGRLESSNNMLYTDLRPKNFVADIEFSNPADPKIHPWDFETMFRYSSVENCFILVLCSDGTWSLLYPAQRLAYGTTTERVGNGNLPMMNLSPTGSNKVRFVANESTGYLFVNGELGGMMDLSKDLSSGQLYFGTGGMIGYNFPGLVMPYKNLAISGLP